MAKSKKAVVEDNEEKLEGILETVTPTVIVAADKPPEVEGVEVTPDINSVNWTPFLMSKLNEDEIFDGCPTVFGLRRLCEEYLGTVISSVSTVVQAPNASNMNHSCIEHRITIHCEDGVCRTYSGVSDVFSDNSDNVIYSYQHSSATCETRSESRAYRRALKLRHIIAAEELGTASPANCGANERMSRGQKNIYSVVCERINLNVMKYLSAGKKVYTSPTDVPHEVAMRAFAFLQKWQRKPSDIPEELRGYDPEWLKSDVD